MKNHYSFTVVLFLLLNLGCNENPPLQEASRPNVLFIAVDDLRTELGAYGNAMVKSPNMDAIARSGSTFTRHYVQVPTCGASRHALLTGMRPYKPIHLKNNAIEVEISGQPEKSVPETFIHRFKREGYHTVGIGKISHSADGLVYGYEEEPSNIRELPHSWTELLFDPGKWENGWNAFFGYASGENRQSLKKQVKPYEAADTDDQGYPDGLTTKLAISKLKELQDNDKPFLIGVGFFKPHLPFNAPKKYWDLYNRDSIKVSPNGNIPENINLASLHNNGEFNQYALGEERATLDEPVSEFYAQKLRHAYMASISYIDAQIGQLVSELDTLGLSENTIIIIWGDHGWHLGDQRIWGKHTLFENALKSTLIIKSPNIPKQRQNIETIVESVDIYPSLLELCDIPLEHKIDGASFVPLLKGEESKEAELAFGYFKEGITVRTPDYRLTKYYRQEQPEVELYDHTDTSYESVNIATEKPEVVTRLMPLLEKGNTGIFDNPKEK